MFRTLFRVGVLTAALGLCLAASRPAAAQRFTIQFLGSDVNESSGINSQGMVAGSHDAANGNYHAFRWLNGVLTDLGTLPSGPESEGYAINDNGDVVGVAITAAGDYHSYLSLNGGPLIDIDPRLNIYSEARAINASGTVTGLAQTAPASIFVTPIYHAFSWTAAGGMKDLGTLGGPNSVGYGMNATGTITGGAQLPSVVHHAVTWDTSGKITDLGVLPGDTWSYGYAINDSGVVVGVGGILPASAFFHAVMWVNGTIQNLGTLRAPIAPNSEALGVNNAGQVVGWSSTDALDTPALRRAFLFVNNTMVDLNTLIPPGSGWVLQRATGINNNGQIVGEGLLNGIPRLYVLTPVP